MPRGKEIAAFLTLILAIIVILAPLTFFGFKIFGEAQMLYVHIISGGTGPFLQFVNSKLSKVAGPFAVNLDQYITQALGVVVGNLGGILSRLVGVVWISFLSLFGFYYLLKDGEEVRGMLIRVVPLPEKHTAEILRKLEEMASSVIRGSLLVAVAYGVIIGVGFAIFGLQGPVLWGTISVVAALVPVLGVSLVAIPAIAALVLTGNMSGAIGFAIWIFIIAIFMENFVRPRLIGRKAKVHPLLLLLSVLGGLQLFGPMGILLGPLALSLLLALFAIYPEVALDRKS
jgi:predicted PurR-regulated permease PerM